MKKKHKTENAPYHKLQENLYEVVTVPRGKVPIHWGGKEELIPFTKKLYSNLNEHEKFINSPKCVSSDMKAYCRRINDIGKKTPNVKIESIGYVVPNYKIANYV